MRTPLPKLPHKKDLSSDEKVRINNLPEITLSHSDIEYFNSKANDDLARYEYDQTRIARQLKKASDINEFGR